MANCRILPPPDQSRDTDDLALNTLSDDSHLQHSSYRLSFVIHDDDRFKVQNQPTWTPRTRSREQTNHGGITGTLRTCLWSFYRSCAMNNFVHVGLYAFLVHLSVLHKMHVLLIFALWCGCKLHGDNVSETSNCCVI